MEALLSLTLFAVFAVAFLYIGLFILKGVIKAFTRLWWLALILLILLPGVLVGWAIGEMLFTDDDPINTNKRKE